MANVDLPVEIIREVLSRLPIKSLMRFRSVCKPWCRLFRSQSFIAKHHYNHQTLDSNSSVIVKHDDASEEHCFRFCFSVLSSSSSNDDERVTLVDSIIAPFSNTFVDDTIMLGPVNGLICLYGRIRQDWIVLFNPATRDYKTIPISMNNKDSDRLSSLFHLGFGFDNKTSDYKIVRFVCSSHAGTWHVELYSLKNDSWRELPSLDGLAAYNTFYTARFNPYVNGVAYWWAERPPARRILLSFDFANEVFEKLVLPFDLLSSRPNDTFQLAIVNGLLSVVKYASCLNIDFQGAFLQTMVHIWSMAEHGSWKKLEVIGPVPANDKPIGFWKQYWFFAGSNLSLYDPITKQEYDLPLPGGPETLQVAASYVESLVPVNGTQEDNPEHQLLFIS